MKLTKEINFIYNKVSNKDLTLGCKFQYKDYCGNDILTLVLFDDNLLTYINAYGEIEKEEAYYYDFLIGGKFNIIGHPVFIGDIIDYLENNLEYDLFGTEVLENLLIAWKNKKEPIENQPDNIIKYIYDLMNKEE